MTRPLPQLTDEEIPRAASDDEPGFGSLATAKGLLPLRAMDIQGRIDGLLSQVTVRQTFVNPFDEPLEATYIFPLPDRAAVRGFRMEVGGRTIKGTLEERAKARQDYDTAIAAGRRAAIAEEERPGVFTLRVGNIMPGEEATVHLDMTGVLPYSGGEVTFRFPLVVAPRYIPGTPLSGRSVGDGTAVDTDAVPDASRISPPVLLPGFPNPVRLSLTIDLYDDNGCVATDGVRSSLHAVLTEQKGGFRRIRLDPGDRLDRDFILRFRLGSRDPAAPIHSTLTFHPDGEGDGRAGTFALTLIPPAAAEFASRPRDVVFVLDRSGSMEGWKIVAARRALARMVDTLGAADRFAVLAFDNVVETPPGLPLDLAPATDRNRFSALEYLARINARGGTQMAEPLLRAADRLTGKKAGHEKRPAREEQGRDAILVLVTDGQVGNEDQILRTLAPKLGGIRVFTLGIDRAVNEAFLRRLAELGHGRCELVESEDRLDEVMEAIHRQIGTPLLTDLALEPVGFTIEPDSLVPERLPDLFAGAPVLVLGRFQGQPAGRLAVRARAASGLDWCQSLEGNPRDNPAIASAWARGQVRKLEDRYVVAAEDLGALERRIVAVSLRFGVLSRFTAYVAIDHAETATKGGKLHRITQPVELPQGWALQECGSMSLGGNVRSVPYMSPMPVPPPPPSNAPGPDDTAEFGFSESPTLTNLPSQYEIREWIGRGGIGSTFEAFDRNRGESVSITLLRGSADNAEELLERTPSLMGLSHPSLALPLDAGRCDEGIFVVTPSARQGIRLNQVLKDRRPEPAESARWIAEIAEAIQYLDERGVLCWDVKPGTIIVGPEGRAVLTDLWEHTVTAENALSGEVCGTLAYMPPERVSALGQPLDCRCATYSLGIVLYELLTGICPFSGSSPQETVQKVLTATPRSPRAIRRSIPKDVEAICLKAMARKPEDRYATPGELAQALRQFLSGQANRKQSFWKRE
ncbi:MAG: VIT domain-containing protein [Isosphaeraceae bacterium]|jgi:Ca-activated chloride channel family protein